MDQRGYGYHSHQIDPACVSEKSEGRGLKSQRVLGIRQKGIEEVGRL